MKHALIEGTRIAQIVDAPFPVAPSLKWVQVADDVTERDTFVSDAVVKAPARSVPAPPTIDELYDNALLTQRLLKGLVLALNDGSFVVGGNKTGAQVKAIIKAKM